MTGTDGLNNSPKIRQCNKLSTLAAVSRLSEPYTASSNGGLTERLNFRALTGKRFGKA